MTASFKALPVAAALVGLTFAGPANAQANPWKMTYACRSSLGTFCVYDQGDNLLGISLDEGRLTREINGKLYFAGYGANGLTVDLALVYKSKDCSGSPLIQSGYIGLDGATVVADAPPKWVPFDGTHFWGASGPAAVVSPQSNVCYGSVCNGNPEGVCMPFSSPIAPYYPTFAPAAVIETPKIAPSTAACEAAQNCVSIK